MNLFWLKLNAEVPNLKLSFCDQRAVQQFFSGECWKTLKSMEYLISEYVLLQEFGSQPAI